MLRKKEKQTTMASNGSNHTTLIARQTEVSGNIHFRGNLVIEGKVKGNVSANSDSEARLQIVEGGIIEGEIRVPQVVINGHVHGDVYAARHLELAAKAMVEGNVHYKLIEMVKGAQVNGALVSNVDVSSAGEPQRIGYTEDETVIEVS
ncbi:MULTISPECIES: polymer-forming cytoskeletal protein [unclassified Microbulbifer]|uniref:Polymer-forming cytoskeletal protein n=1 Tax=Microbulbifer spongiae TaxID=2944933 RepID=A0ABY9E8R9_9GAMM|nr:MULTISPECIES: polymer-forming cytoskeletal protein [unclassified Microbulbifer]MDP5208759.1 polymer-forming cytoskeletal protein [Microbulbifer sp. 2205BS26-8]WKD49410.1 polymer-forming cytoskeletal protein [Microbulbifer sp. MI-G]